MLRSEIEDWCGTGWPHKWPKPEAAAGLDDSHGLRRRRAGRRQPRRLSTTTPPSCRSALGLRAEQLADRARRSRRRVSVAHTVVRRTGRSDNPLVRLGDPAYHRTMVPGAEPEVLREYRHLLRTASADWQETAHRHALMALGPQGRGRLLTELQRLLLAGTRLGGDDVHALARLVVLAERRSPRILLDGLPRDLRDDLAAAVVGSPVGAMLRRRHRRLGRPRPRPPTRPAPRPRLPPALVRAARDAR